MKLIYMSVGAALITTFAVPCHAQSSDYETALLGQAMEARVGITVPFGGDNTSDRSKPRLALIGRRTNASKTSMDWALNSGGIQKDYVETRLSLTLSKTPELRLNGQDLYSFETESAEVSDGVKTAGKVALGAGLITLAAAVVFVGVYAIGYESEE